VLCETARHCIQLVEREFSKKIHFDELVNYDLGVSCGLGPVERARLYEMIHEPDEILALSPVNEAIQTIRVWADEGYDIGLVTGRPPWTTDSSLAWLDRHSVPHSSFTVVDKYGRYDITGTSAIRLEDLAARRYAWAVEDSLPIAQFLGSRMGLPVLLVDRPWNRVGDMHSNIVRHTDWDAIRRHTLSFRTSISSAKVFEPLR
jgi:uncharacterized HAD superfamily protein